MGNDDQIYEWTQETVDTLAGATFEPLNEVWEAGKVADKWFVVTGILRGERLINVKAIPEAVCALQRVYPEIRPGFHMNKKHWVTITSGENITSEVLKELITESYLLVVEKLPKIRRPYGWELHDPELSG